MQDFEAYITEAFDNPYPWKKQAGTPDGGWKATFVADNGAKYVFIAVVDRSGQAWDVEFVLSNPPDKRGESTGITGSAGKDAFRIFATIRDIFIKFAKQAKPSSISFSADKFLVSVSRSKIYVRFAKDFARKNKYKLHVNDTQRSTEFFFTKDQT